MDGTSKRAQTRLVIGIAIAHYLFENSDFYTTDIQKKKTSKESTLNGFNWKLRQHIPPK